MSVFVLNTMPCRVLKGWFPLQNEKSISWLVYLQVRLKFNLMQIDAPSSAGASAFSLTSSGHGIANTTAASAAAGAAAAAATCANPSAGGAWLDPGMVMSPSPHAGGSSSGKRSGAGRGSAGSTAFNQLDDFF